MKKAPSYFADAPESLIPNSLNFNGIAAVGLPPDPLVPIALDFVIIAGDDIKDNRVNVDDHKDSDDEKRVRFNIPPDEPKHTKRNTKRAIVTERDYFAHRSMWRTNASTHGKEHDDYERKELGED